MNFKQTTARDLFHLFVGDKIGEGMSRKVYKLEQDKNNIVKVEEYGTNFQNIIEWQIWREVQYSKYAKWFAPCISISPNGIYLIQQKTQTIPKEEYPKEMPAFFNDFKYSNYGIIYEKGKKRFVCHDYGIVSCIGKLNGRMKKVNWGDWK